MDETRQLIDALKRSLKAHGVTYKSLGTRIGLSEASVKRIFAERTFSLKRLEQVCRALDMSIADLTRMIAHHSQRPTTVDLSQEAALAKDPALLTYFYLILNGWSDAQIRLHYEFEAADTVKMFDRLVELALIDELPKRKFRSRVSRQIIWRRNGPIRQAYERQVHAEFLKSPFDDARAYLAWQPAELTATSIDVLRRKLAQLNQDFFEMGDLDQHSSQPRYSTALLMAFRPWVFSLVAARQRRAQAKRTR